MSRTLKDPADMLPINDRHKKVPHLVTTLKKYFEQTDNISQREKELAYSFFSHISKIIKCGSGGSTVVRAPTYQSGG